MLAAFETALAFFPFEDSQILPVCHSQMVVLQEEDYGQSNDGILWTGQKRDIT